MRGVTPPYPIAIMAFPSVSSSAFPLLCRILCPTSTNASVEVSVRSSDTLERLGIAVANALGIKPPAVRLCFRGAVLRDQARTLADVGILMPCCCREGVENRSPEVSTTTSSCVRSTRLQTLDIRH